MERRQERIAGFHYAEGRRREPGDTLKEVSRKKPAFAGFFFGRTLLPFSFLFRFVPVDVALSHCLHHLRRASSSMDDLELGKEIGKIAA
jgi:hypothetical protein